MKTNSLLALISLSVAAIAAAPILGFEAVIAISSVAGLAGIALADYGRPEKPLSKVKTHASSLRLAA